MLPENQLRKTDNANVDWTKMHITDEPDTIKRTTADEQLVQMKMKKRSITDVQTEENMTRRGRETNQ